MPAIARSMSLALVSVLLLLLTSACTVVVMDHDNIDPGAMHAAPAEGTAEPVEEAPSAHADHGAHADSNLPFDAQFIDGMIEHHQGAVDMARQVLAESERPELLALAEAIIAAQEAEIAQMLAWRDAWYPDLPATTGMAMDMGEMEISADASIPFDQRFLTAMISHHLGAVDMARMALEMAENEEIRALATAIIVDQEAEIAQMRAWLLEWYDVELP
jgi:uncharacterized protein (DUF305 family)